MEELQNYQINEYSEDALIDRRDIGQSSVAVSDFVNHANSHMQAPHQNEKFMMGQHIVGSHTNTTSARGASAIADLGGDASDGNPDAALEQLLLLLKANQSKLERQNAQHADHSAHPPRSSEREHDVQQRETSATRQANILYMCSLEELRKYFHLPIVEVARQLGICTTLLKKVCRKNGIFRWPYRQIKSITKSIQSLEVASLNESLNDRERARYKDQIVMLHGALNLLIQNPNAPVGNLVLGDLMDGGMLEGIGVGGMGGDGIDDGDDGMEEDAGASAGAGTGASAANPGADSGADATSSSSSSSSSSDPTLGAVALPGLDSATGALTGGSMTPMDARVSIGGGVPKQMNANRGMVIGGLPSIPHSDRLLPRGHVPVPNHEVAAVIAAAVATADIEVNTESTQRKRRAAAMAVAIEEEEERLARARATLFAIEDSNNGSMFGGAGGGGPGMMGSSPTMVGSTIVNFMLVTECGHRKLQFRAPVHLAPLQRRKVKAGKRLVPLIEPDICNHMKMDFLCTTLLQEGIDQAHKPAGVGQQLSSGKEQGLGEGDSGQGADHQHQLSEHQHQHQLSEHQLSEHQLSEHQHQQHLVEQEHYHGQGQGQVQVQGQPGGGYDMGHMGGYADMHQQYPPLLPHGEDQGQGGPVSMPGDGGYYQQLDGGHHTHGHGQLEHVQHHQHDLEQHLHPQPLHHQEHHPHHQQHLQEHPQQHHHVHPEHHMHRGYVSQDTGGHDHRPFQAQDHQHPEGHHPVRSREAEDENGGGDGGDGDGDLSQMELEQALFAQANEDMNQQIAQQHPIIGSTTGPGGGEVR